VSERCPICGKPLLETGSGVAWVCQNRACVLSRTNANGYLYADDLALARANMDKNQKDAFDRGFYAGQLAAGGKGK
jgi:hypothetical protein